MATSTPLSSDSLAGGSVNLATDRRAIGYPDHYVATPYEAPCEAFRRLMPVGPHELTSCIEDPRVALEDRLVAGRLLALIGDERIDPYDPPMIDVPGGGVVLGLEQRRLEEVLADLADTKVLPAWIAKECPSHEAQLAPFRIGKYAVTNHEYREFLGATSHAATPTSWEFGRYPHERANHPVYTVSAEAADAYAAWLRAETGRPFRLPSEAEWEHAAAGPARLQYPWGNTFDSARANTAELGLLCTSPVGAFPLGNSPFGACDMAGNVEEYVAGDYAPYPGASAVDDDLARVWGKYRVARGGSFTRLRDLGRCTRRHGYFPKPIYVMGFRLAEGI